ncbi:CAP domain-containing protein [Rubrivirga sp. IMCC43871]|uniref:CAP domain-containing protein n=1 Tax=Rubrivirga sp. IMCC43871 TaxID=3391575 RepID=UPI00398FD513
MFRIVLLAALALAACDTTYAIDDALVADAPAWDAMLAAVNDARASGAVCGNEAMGPAAPLVWDARLEAAAERHSRDMAENGHFDHTGTDGLSTGARVRRAGYDWRAVGENIARYHQNVDEVVSDWLASPDHCRQMLSPRFVELGAAEEDGYWTQVFGVPR